jgi:hypothetical protein
MKREQIIWTIVFVLGGVGLFYNAVLRPGGMAKQYVIAEPVSSGHPQAGEKYVASTPLEHQADPQNVRFSLSRTVGVWFAAFLTLCIFSFLYRDNPFYKFAESVFVGVSAAAIMVAAFWEQIVPNVLGEIVPNLMKISLYPAVEIDPNTKWKFWTRLAALGLGVMLLWRLMPKGQWIARWPLAIIIGSMAGARMVVFIQTDLMGVVGSTIVPVVAIDPATGFDFWQSLRQSGIVLGVLVCLFYFFFSIEHKGAAGRIAMLGIWVLMITFGASFALTVMGRIALLSERFQFLFDDWLWIIDPTHARSPASMLM